MRLRQFAILDRGAAGRGQNHAARTRTSNDSTTEPHDGYVRAARGKEHAEDAARIENVQELKSNIIAFAKEADNPTLAGFLDEVALYTDLDNYDQSMDCVTLMTMHAAAGLEFPTVFIVGCEEGIFPGLRCIGEPDEMEEERRLCYVALTARASTSSSRAPASVCSFGRTTANRVSRFVEEIPEEDIQKLNVPARLRLFRAQPRPAAVPAAPERAACLYGLPRRNRVAGRPCGPRRPRQSRRARRLRPRRWRPGHAPRVWLRCRLEDPAYGWRCAARGGI
ncbi:MAG: 3'-5' exonuclease [Oscillospiraceae bacterium]